MEYRASHILVKDRALAERILKDLQKGVNFESMARQYSTCPSKGKGGDLDWFGPGQMVRPFEEAVARMSVGKVSAIVPTQFGLHIIKKTGQR